MYVSHTRQCAEGFMCIFLIDSYDTGIPQCEHYHPQANWRQGNWTLKRVSDLPRVTEQTTEGGKVQIQMHHVLKSLLSISSYN